jgi:hypothetical protein
MAARRARTSAGTARMLSRAPNAGPQPVRHETNTLRRIPAMLSQAPRQRSPKRRRPSSLAACRNWPSPPEDCSHAGRHAGAAASGQQPALTRNVPVCPLMMIRDGMRWRPPRRLREATMKAGHSVLLPMRTAGSPPSASPRRPAPTILLSTGRPFRQWLPALGELTERAGLSARRSPGFLSAPGSAGTSTTLLALRWQPVVNAHFRPFAAYHVAWPTANWDDPAPGERPGQ